MRYYCILVLLLLHTNNATYTWRKPTIFQIKEEVFKEKVIDEYTAEQSTANVGPVTHDPVHLFSDRNPYKSNITRFAVYDANYIDPIPVYNLNGLQVKLINEVYVECYEYDDCAYELTPADRHELSLYASFIEMSGTNAVSDAYSLGLIRSKYTTNILGMYTQGFDVLSNNIGFWIRLKDASNTRLYTELESYSKTIAMLDMSIHERSHYDQPTFSSGAAHCDPFQANYNFLFQRAARDITSYVGLTVMNEPFYITTEWWLIGALVVLFIAFVIMLIYFGSCRTAPIPLANANLLKPI